MGKAATEQEKLRQAKARLRRIQHYEQVTHDVRHDVKVYPGAPHNLFDRKYTEFAEASADAWKGVQAFVR